MRSDGLELWVGLAARATAGTYTGAVHPNTRALQGGVLLASNEGSKLVLLALLPLRLTRSPLHVPCFPAAATPGPSLVATHMERSCAALHGAVLCCHHLRPCAAALLRCPAARRVVWKLMVR